MSWHTTTALVSVQSVSTHYKNCVHWVLDVTFSEDGSRIRSGDAPQNFAVLRHSALNLLRRETSVGSIATKRFRAALDDAYLVQVLRA